MKIQKKSPKSINLHCCDEQVHLLREIMRVHQALLGIANREVGMPSARLALLRQLAISHPEGVGIMDLARRLGVNAAAVTRHVKEMKAERLVGRFLDIKDNRRNYVKLTPEGVQIFEEFHKRAHEFESLICKTIEPDDLTTTIRVLSQVRAAIEEYQ
ncbi:MAG TPA: MarR family transcriptional regulator [candidate division Zixibacteria bacterium]|nr:MarR family transcriptional regulator [candidate division Zixibacteria bacterium]HBZ01796.1 MarR family transcriptional regulator [candidate division Zixibacteria bacterium]